MITLADNSLKKCGDKNIKLSKMLTLLTGDTWLTKRGKYGFIPIERSNETNKYKIDKLNYKYYIKNKEIINKITITDINLLEILSKTNNEKIIKSAEKLLTINPKMLIANFLQNLLNHYDKNCKLFVKFYEELFYKIMVYNPYKQLFGLII